MHDLGGAKVAYMYGYFVLLVFVTSVSESYCATGGWVNTYFGINEIKGEELNYILCICSTN